MIPSTRVARGSRRATGAKLIALVVLCAVYGNLLPSEAAETSKPTRASGLSVSVKPARNMCFTEQVEVTGTVFPRQEVEIPAPREGRLTDVLVGPLDQVAAGQILARLGPADGATSTTVVSVTSSVAGVVVHSDAATGKPVSPRQGPLFRIVVGGDLDVKADVPIGDLKRLAVGQPVTVRPLGQPELSGKLQLVASPIEPGSQLGRVRIALPTTRDLRVGTFARAIILVGERCGIGVPYSSIMYEPDGTILQIVKNDRVEARHVILGLLLGSYVEVRSGISASDLIVTRAGPFLRDGDQVTPITVQDTTDAKMTKARE
jgi:HlyD family secretion protein